MHVLIASLGESASQSKEEEEEEPPTQMVTIIICMLYMNIFNIGHRYKIL